MVCQAEGESEQQAAEASLSGITSRLQAFCVVPPTWGGDFPLLKPRTATKWLVY